MTRGSSIWNRVGSIDRGGCGPPIRAPSKQHIDLKIVNQSGVHVRQRTLPNLSNRFRRCWPAGEEYAGSCPVAQLGELTWSCYPTPADHYVE